MQKGQYKVIQS